MKEVKLSIFIFLIIFAVLLSIGVVRNKDNSTLLSPLADIVQNIPGFPHSRLKEITAKSLEGAKGQYAVYIKNLKTGEGYSLNEHEEFDTGSLYKLWTMAVVYEDIKKGSLSREQILSEDVEALNKKFKISSESAELKEGTITLSVGGALNQMIAISSNYAAHLLTAKIGLSPIARFLKQEGFDESSIGASDTAPKSTAYDIGSFFEKLYKGEIVDKFSSEEMISILKKQQLNSKLPGNLPEGTPVAHKTGEIDYYSHDGGIIFGNKSDYVIVVLSKSSYPPGAVERIADISKAVFDYFEN